MADKSLSTMLIILNGTRQARYALAETFHKAGRVYYVLHRVNKFVTIPLIINQTLTNLHPEAMC